MSDAQTWTIIGVLAATVLSAMGLIAGTFTRVMRAEMAGLRGELTGQSAELRGEVTGQIGELRGEVRALGVTIESVDPRLEGLDSDVDALTRKIMGEDTA